MVKTAREEILERLTKAPQEDLAPRPPGIPQVKIPAEKDVLIEKFTQEITAMQGAAYVVKDQQAALETLKEITAAENITKVMASTDEVLSPIDLQSWGQVNQVTVFEADGFKDRTAFKNAVFDKVDAGITGADFAVAESGSLIIRHNKDQARLISLAPITHIAIVPIDRLVPYYEDAVSRIFIDRKNLSSQVTIITGPSATADIAATPVVGMHGLRKIFVIFVG